VIVTQADQQRLALTTAEICSASSLLSFASLAANDGLTWNHMGRAVAQLEVAVARLKVLLEGEPAPVVDAQLSLHLVMPIAARAGVVRL
jgi:hypothetical protein